MIKFFFSGASGIRNDVLPRLVAKVRYRLLSMHPSYRSLMRTWAEAAKDPTSAIEEVMLDSGAFTAFTKGKKVEIHDLIAAYADAIEKFRGSSVKQIWLINLDVIPGAYGRMHTEKELEQALDESDNNCRLLQKRFGTDRILPVYHQVEPLSRLEEICKQSPFVGMGFRQDFNEEHRIGRAELAVEYAHARGIRVHGLATTGYKMLRRVPFDTVDSTSWLLVAAMGGILFRDSEGEPTSVSVSITSPNKHIDRQHFTTIRDDERALIHEQIKQAGVTLQELETDLSMRILFCAHTMNSWLSDYSRPTLVVEKGLFPDE